jgi:hypothetical protein
MPLSRAVIAFAIACRLYAQELPKYTPAKQLTLQASKPRPQLPKRAIMHTA